MQTGPNFLSIGVKILRKKKFHQVSPVTLGEEDSILSVFFLFVALFFFSKSKHPSII
jgi:hypothetical protein